jgi:hypothetical protein
MSLTDYAEIYFTNYSIVYDDVETNICKLLPSVLFEADKTIEYRQISIPDNTLHNFHMYQFGDNEHVRNLYNVRLGRLSEPEELTYATPITAYSLVTDYTHDDDEVLTAGIHGDGILFDTEDTARTIIMEVSVVGKTPSVLDEEIREAVKYMYYYLYTEDINGYYNYMRRLSLLKKNRMNENVKTKTSRKVYYETLNPLVM